MFIPATLVGGIKKQTQKYYLKDSVRQKLEILAKRINTTN